MVFYFNTQYVYVDNGKNVEILDKDLVHLAKISINSERMTAAFEVENKYILIATEKEMLYQFEII